MCGRFVLSIKDLAKFYSIYNSAYTKIPPHYNISPGMYIPAMKLDNGEKVILEMYWGFTYGKEGEKQMVINAKSETLGEKPMFKNLVGHQHCLIPATGFYEWAVTENGKIPYYFKLKEQEVFSFAGLWRRTSEGESCLIITTKPNKLLEKIHNRMPVILTKDKQESWLKAKTFEEIQTLLEPLDAKLMESYPVSKKVNNAKNDGVELVEKFEYELKHQDSLIE